MHKKKDFAPLSHLQSDGPLDLVCMDFLSIEPDSSNTENVLVITDHYTCYAQAFPTKDQKASMAGKSPNGEILCPLWIAEEDAQ